MLGSHLVLEAMRAGYNVTALVNTGSLDKRPWARRVLAGARIVEASLGDAGLLRRMLGGERFDLVVHTAAVMGGARREWRVNYEDTRNLLSVLDGNVGVFVFISSILALGDTLAETALEDAECRPRSVYEKSKCMAETLVAMEAEEQGFRHVIVRPSWMYGPYSLNPDMPRLLKLAKRGIAPVLGGRSAVLGLVYAGDVAGAVYALTLSGASGVYNVRGPRMYGSLELAEALSRAVDREKAFKPSVPRILFRAASRFSAAARYLALMPRDIPIRKLETATGFHPRVDLEEGLSAMAEWMMREGLL